MGGNAKWLMSLLLAMSAVVPCSSSINTPAQAYKANPTEILTPPDPADWKSLERFSATLTRQEFEHRLHSIFDPTGAIYLFLDVTDQCVKIYPDPSKTTPPLAEIAFATSEYRRPSPSGFRSPAEIQNTFAPTEKPLSGLRIVVDPADIGGKWAAMENRAQSYKGFGEIREGDLNLTVAKILIAKLEALGASVFLTHSTSEPVSGLYPQDLLESAATLLAENPTRLPRAFFDRSRGVSKKNPRLIQIAAETLLTKTVEARARAEMVRKVFQPDITFVLQHDATPRSAKGHIARLNRNVFFIHGAYTHQELTEDPHQRFKMLTKLLANVTPIEVMVADHISNRFISITGFQPVNYGDSSITRSISNGNPYVVARNLALNREYDGPVVVVEPYFMNEATTLRRLLEGDYDGVRFISGELRPSIYREYADAVTLGILDAYGYRPQVSSRLPSPDTALLEGLSIQALSLPTLIADPTPAIRLQEMLSMAPPQSLSLRQWLIGVMTPFIRPAIIVGIFLGASVGLLWIATRPKNKNYRQ